MWKLSEIQIENIVSFREASLKVTQGVATLIFGKNEDNAAQPCNGSGKSSLIEAISFALTGEQLRKVKSVEEIINDHADDAWVKITLDNDYDGTTFVIERTIKRGAAQVIECHKYNSEGLEIEKDKTVQPTVADYNKFILYEIGLSKDDIYNNYILCDNKYESFFDCSDKNKKEVINRFSNGQIIDESIERVQSDMQPIEEDLVKANSDVTRLQGSIAAIESELEQVDVKKADAQLERETRIKSLDDKIAKCRAEINVHQENKAKGENRIAQLQVVQADVTALEESEESLIDCYQKIVQYCVDNSLGAVTNFEELSDKYKRQLAEQADVIKATKSALEEQQEILEQQKKDCEAQKHTYQLHCNNVKRVDESSADRRKALMDEIKKIDVQLDNIEKQTKQNKTKIKELESESVRIETLLSGVIVCPKCQHHFLLNRKDSVEDLRQDLQSAKEEVARVSSENEKLNKQYDELNDDAGGKEEFIATIDKEVKERQKTLEDEYAKIRKLSMRVDDTDNQILSLNKKLVAAQNELDKLNGKIDVLRQRLFGEINGILEGRLINGKQYIEQQDSAITFTEGQMKHYQSSKKELIETPLTDFESSLKNSLAKYTEELEQAQIKASEIQAQYDELKGQEVNFTMFKSYIARKKINALSLIINDFLEKIGSDIRLKLEGFTVTKTGKLRDKISVQVMRDGVDCGSYQKFSGGEKARLNLACILSLHTLTNNNCEDGKGLDFIIIDELLDKSDEVGMTTYCEALNKLKQTALLITQGGVAEGYPHKLLITKRQGVSTITE